VIDYLQGFRFIGDVHALPEGTVCFTDEPLIRVVAPLPAAQLVESRLINILHYQTLIASKAARMVLQAPDKLLIDFGMRRAHGGEAGLFAARAAYLAGFAGSATVLAERDYGVPCYGTVAHSFVQAHDDEVQAFLNYARGQPENAILLIDTYDTVAGARKVAELAPRLAAEGIRVRGVRLDSGDLAALAREVRDIFDKAGLEDISIFASGSIDEYALADMAASGVPIDGYGIGTHLTTSADVPYLDCAYKLQEYAGVARRKRSTGKATWPGRKQVYRQYDDRGVMTGDTITVEGDTQPGEVLMRQVMKDGKRTSPAEPLADVRQRTLDGYARLPAGLKALTPGKPYPVTISPALERLAVEVDKRTEG
jgi:nicotinate phosphoribosyltransferase